MESHPIRIQNSLIISISLERNNGWDYLYRDINQGKITYKLHLLVGCGQAGVPSHVQTSLSLPRVDWLILGWCGHVRKSSEWKDSVFLSCLTYTFKWLTKMCAFVQSDCRILWSSISLVGSNNILEFLRRNFLRYQRKITCKSTTMVRCGQLCPATPRLPLTCQRFFLDGLEAV